MRIFILFAQEYQAVVDAEWKILYDKLEALHKCGAKVILSKLPIGDVATQYFADRYLLQTVVMCILRNLYYFLVKDAVHVHLWLVSVR